MTKEYCDACGDQLDANAEHLKYRRWWSNWGETGWSPVDLCHGCWTNLRKLEIYKNTGRKI